jgi:two-component system, LytTR family, sensor kinase
MHLHPETRPTPAGPPAWAIAAPWVACGLIATSQAYFLWPPASGPSLVRALEGQLPPWLYLAAVAPLVVRIARRYPLARDTWKRAIRPHILANLLIAAGYAWIVTLAAYGLDEPYFVQNPLVQCFGKVLAKSVHIELFTYWLIVVLVHAFDYHRKAREGVLTAARLETALAHAQLDALKMQLHPHFLFNTLHAISMLVRKHETQGALRMLSGVGDLLRLALENTGSQLVSLKQELDFLGRYLAIEQVRFHDRLDVRMDIAPDVLMAQVPNLLLQPIVENAIRHGIAPRAAAGRIEVRARRRRGALAIDIRDDGVGLPADFDLEACNGVGLRNVRARLQQLYPGTHRVAVAAGDDGGVVVAIEIPLALEAAHDAA